MIVKKDKQSPKLNAHNLDCWVWKKNKNGKALLVRRGTNAENLPDDYGSEDGDQAMHNLIAMNVANGLSFHKMSGVDGLPSSMTMYRWYNSNEEFRKMIDAAKKIRADHFFDELAEVAKNVKEGNAKSYKVKADVLKHLMAVGNREEYGSQTKVVGDPNAPISFIVDTGIRRLEENPAIPTEGKTIDEPKDADNYDRVFPTPASDGDPSEPEEV
jgi:hypothetical protein